MRVIFSVEEWVVCDCRPQSVNGGVPSSFVCCHGDPTLELVVRLETLDVLCSSAANTEMGLIEQRRAKADGDTQAMNRQGIKQKSRKTAAEKKS
jgi:hypothetical protein